MVTYKETRNEYLDANIKPTRSIINAVGRLRIRAVVKNNKGYSSVEVGEVTGNMRNFDNLIFNAKENAIVKHLERYNELIGGSDFVYISGTTKFGSVKVLSVDVEDYEIYYFDKTLVRKRITRGNKYYTEVRSQGRIVSVQPFRFKRVDLLKTRYREPDEDKPKRSRQRRL